MFGRRSYLYDHAWIVDGDGDGNVNGGEKVGRESDGVGVERA